MSIANVFIFKKYIILHYALDNLNPLRQTLS